MSRCCDHRFKAKASGWHTVAVEIRVRCEARSGPLISIGIGRFRKTKSCSSDVGSVGGQPAECSLNSDGSCLQMPISEMTVDTAQVQKG